jgi:hypothetical protein
LETPRLSEVSDSVSELIDSARKQGVQAEIIETGTFDIMLSKMWRHIPEKPEGLNLKVRTTKALSVSIPLPAPGTRFPILRTNALPIIESPSECGMVEYSDPITFQELNSAVWEHRPNAILSYTDRVLFWGATDEVYKVLKKEKVKAIERFTFEDPVASISGSGFIKSFFEHALAQSLCVEKPLLLRRKDRTYYAVVNHEKVGDPILEPLKSAVGYKGASGYVTGSVRGVKDTFWAEALSIKLEERSGSLWLLIRPDIWVTPLACRESATDFLRSKRIYRYNPQAYRVLDAWIKMLFGTVGEGEEVSVSCFSDTERAPIFKISTRTAFSRGGGANG